MKTGIWLEDLGYDEEDVLHLHLTASNDECAVSQEFYAYVQNVHDFATQLLQFPKTVTDEVTFQIGKDEPKHHCYVLITAYVCDPVGHSALEVHVSQSGNREVQKHSEFSIRSDPAQLSTLGQTLLEWLKSRHTTYEWIPRT